LEIKINTILKSLIIIIPFLCFYNIEIIDGIGIVDLLIDLLFITSLFTVKIDRTTLLFGSLCFSFMIIGVLFFYIFNPNESLNEITLGFVYKNLKIVEILTFGLVLKKYDLKINVQKYLTLILVNFIFWTVFYVFFLKGFVSSFITSRVSFPSFSYEQSDAHLYSYCFGFILASYVLFSHEIKKMIPILIILSSIILLQFTGSRNYIIAIIFPLVFLYIFDFLKFISKSFIFLSASITVVCFFVFIVKDYVDLESLEYLYNRVYNFNLQDDSSASGRINKFLIGIDFFLKGPIVLGIPISSTPLIWFDGIIPSVLLQFGILGFIIILYFTINSYLNLKDKRFKFLFLYIIIGNLITEFIYVTKGLVFSLLIFLILKSLYKSKKINV